jgi:hypothetical protein
VIIVYISQFGREIMSLELCPFPRGELEKDCEEDNLVRVGFEADVEGVASVPRGKTRVRIWFPGRRRTEART